MKSYRTPVPLLPPISQNPQNQHPCQVRRLYIPRPPNSYPIVLQKRERQGASAAALGGGLCQNQPHHPRSLAPAKPRHNPATSSAHFIRYAIRRLILFSGTHDLWFMTCLAPDFIYVASARYRLNKFCLYSRSFATPGIEMQAFLCARLRHRFGTGSAHLRDISTSTERCALVVRQLGGYSTKRQ